MEWNVVFLGVLGVVGVLAYLGLGKIIALDSVENLDKKVKEETEGEFIKKGDLGRFLSVVFWPLYVFGFIFLLAAVAVIVLAIIAIIALIIATIIGLALTILGLLIALPLAILGILISAGSIVVILVVATIVVCSPLEGIKFFSLIKGRKEQKKEEETSEEEVVQED